jgi:hypothetical protein
MVSGVPDSILTFATSMWVRCQRAAMGQTVVSQISMVRLLGLCVVCLFKRLKLTFYTLCLVCELCCTAASWPISYIDSLDDART